MKKLVWLVALAVLVAGCSVGLQTVQKDVVVAGVKHNYVFSEGTGKYGGWLQVMDGYDASGTGVISHSAFGAAGLWSSALNGAVAGAAIGGGVGAGLAVQGAAKVTQSVHGTSSAAGGSATIQKGAIVNDVF